MQSPRIEILCLAHLHIAFIREVTEAIK